MNPKLVACLAASMALGATGAGGVLLAGGGILAAIGTYSLTGSVSLVPIAALAFREKNPNPEAKAGNRPKPAPVYS